MIGIIIAAQLALSPPKIEIPPQKSFWEYNVSKGVYWMNEAGCTDLQMRYIRKLQKTEIGYADACKPMEHPAEGLPSHRVAPGSG